MAGIKRIDGVYCGHPMRNWQIASEPINVDPPVTASIVTTTCGLCGQAARPPYYVSSFMGGKTITTPMPAHAVHSYLERQGNASNRHSGRGRQRQA